MQKIYTFNLQYNNYSYQITKKKLFSIIKNQAIHHKITVVDFALTVAK